MSIATYDELKAAVADFLNREDLTSAIPTFIRLSESRIDRELRHWRQEERADLTLSARYETLPSGYLRAIRLQITDGPTSEVAPISTSQMLQLRADRNDRSGTPTNYSVSAGGLELYPTPDQPYGAALVYYGRITPLSGAAPTNWLLAEAPDVYLYGALTHAAPYLKDDARLQVWEALFKQGLDMLSVSSEDAKFGGTGLRVKTRRGAP